MTKYTVLAQDDSNLDVTLTESDDLVTLNITPAAVNITSAVTSVNGATGNVVLDTDDIDEGATNLYYTDVRAYAANSGGTGVTYNSATGEISIGQSVGTGDDVTFNTVTADDFVGDLNGAVRFVARADVDMSKGQVVYVTGVQGNTSTIDLARANSASTMPAMGFVNSDVTANNNVEVVTLGNLYNLNVADFGETGITFGPNDTVYVSASEAGHVTNQIPGGESNLIQNIGRIQRHTPTANMAIKVGGAGRTNDTPNLNDGRIFIGDSTGHAIEATLDTSRVPENTNLYYTTARANTDFDTRLATKTTDDLTEGTNLYYTDARFDTRLATKDTDDLAEGTNLYYTDARFDTRLATKSTTDLSEGTNLYYTTARSNTDFDTRLATKSTTNLSEGSNLYYTDARVQTVIDTNTAGYITADSTDTLTNKSGNISQWTNDAGYITSETDSQTLSFTSPNLTISNGNSVDLSSLEVDETDGGTY